MIPLMYNRGKEREKEMKVNDFIASLPRIVERKVWRVTDSDGAFVQCVGSTDNKKDTAQEYIDYKYPGETLTLTFSHFRGLITLPQ